MPEKRPAPNNPPCSYRVDRDEAVFFRRVSQAEYEDIRKSNRLEPEPGGTESGKHLTTTPDLAEKWGIQWVESGWEDAIGIVLEVRLPAATAIEIDFVGFRIDGIGACYFARFDQLVCAKLREAKL